MNLYHILGVSDDASDDEIRTAYKNLARLHHPDKNNSEESKEKFHKICSAYSILSDKDKRTKYNIMNSEQKMQLYDLVKEYVIRINPESYTYYDNLIKYAYSGNENQFKEDCDQINLNSIFRKVFYALENVVNESLYEIYKQNYMLEVSLKDKYINKIQTIKINEDDSVLEYNIPSGARIYYLNNDIAIHVEAHDDKVYKQIGDYDLLTMISVSLSQYLYGDTIKIILPSYETHIFKFGSCLEKKPIFIIHNLGLPIISQKQQLNDNERGDLYIYINIDGVNSIVNNDLEAEYFSCTKSIIESIFPPL